MLKNELMWVKDEFILNHWTITKNGSEQVTFVSPTKECEIEISCINENRIFVSTPVPNSNFQYTTHHSDISDVGDYVCQHLENYLENKR